MHIEEICGAIAEEIRRLSAAHAALNGGNLRKARSKHKMSAAAKRRISLAQKRRWAERKKAA